MFQDIISISTLLFLLKILVRSKRYNARTIPNANSSP